MKIKKGDLVKVMKGKDHGKQGKVTQILPADGLLVVEGLNRRVKHLKAQKEGQKGQRIEFDAPMKVCNVQVICPKCNKVTRVGFDTKTEKKERLCRKCKQII